MGFLSAPIHGLGTRKDPSAKSERVPLNTGHAPIGPPKTDQTVIIVDNAKLRPGTCVVCRKGKIKERASLWTWVACLLLLPLGVLPGILAFCCCFRRPKCTDCGFTV
ncbi:uncharacterized protein LOC122249558 [Penaeus japonicus]|nr:uncharacterized protein LOC122249558 [Penaeus japonicus]